MTVAEQQLRAEIDRLVNLFADKNIIIARLECANLALHDECERWRTRYEAAVTAPPAPHLCSGCGELVAAEAVAWADGMAWLCVECASE